MLKSISNVVLKQQAIRKLFIIFMAILLIAFLALGNNITSYGAPTVPANLRPNSAMMIDPQKPDGLSLLRNQQPRKINRERFMQGDDDKLFVNPASAVTLNFYSEKSGRGKLLDGSRLRLRGEGRSQVQYSFPCKTRGGKTGIEYRVAKNLSCSRGVLIAHINQTRSSIDNHRSVQANKSLAAVETTRTSHNGTRYFCNAVSDFGRTSAFYLSEVPQRWNIFSQNDSCQKAVRKCEGIKPGVSCNIFDRGRREIDGSEVIVSLNCGGNKFKPFTPIPYSELIADTEIDAAIDRLEQKIDSDEAKVCFLNIYDSGTVAILPGKDDLIRTEADATGQNIVISAPKGSVGIQAGKKGQRQLHLETLPEGSRYIYDVNEKEAEIQEMPLPEQRSILRREPLVGLRGPISVNKVDTFNVKTINGEIINPWEKLGFSLDIPLGWKAITNQKGLRAVFQYIQDQEPLLTTAYVERSLALIKESGKPKVASTLQSEVSGYVNPTDTRFMAIDLEDLAGIHVGKQTGISANNAVKSYLDELQNKASRNHRNKSGSNANINLAEYISNRPLKIANQNAYEIKTRINFKGSFGEISEGYRKEPDIGAGRTVFREATEGKIIELIHVSYWIPQRDRNGYILIGFTTTPDRYDKYNAQFEEIARSFRFIDFVL